MVRFDNFHVKGIAKDACRLLGEGTQQGNAEAHVAGAENRHDFRRFGDLMKLLVGQPGGRNHDRDAVLHGVIQHVRAGLPVGEVNHHIRLGGVGIVRIEGEIRLIRGDPGGNVHAAHHVNAGGFCLRGDLAAHEAARAADEDGHCFALLLVFPKKIVLFCCRGFRVCGRDQRAMKTDERLRSPFGNLRSAHPCFLVFFAAAIIYGSG
jgi:hypothetical protein